MSGSERRRAETANDRFKQRFGQWVWSGVIVAALGHFALFQFFPSLSAAGVARESDFLRVLPLPELELPQPPKEISRPRPPVVTSKPVDEDVTIHRTTLEENRFETLPPPPSTVRGRDAGRLTPYTVRPELRDPARALRIVERHYPELLRAAGIGGTVTVRAYIDTLGRVTAVELGRSSGHEALDRAALEAVKLFEFTPALNRDQKVAVWVEQRIVFEVK
jgi:protein TonB